MDEITLTCEACGVRYRLGASAIPAAGREVECSACGHMWFARPDEAPEPEAPEPPRLTRPLSRDVLDILLGEVEHERKARAADQVEPPADEPEDPADKSGSDSFWPATTLTDAPKDTAPLPAPEILPPAIIAPVAPPQSDPQPVFEARETGPIPVPEAAPDPDPVLDQPVTPEPAPIALADPLPGSPAPSVNPAPTPDPAVQPRLNSQPLISGSVPVRHTPAARAAAAAYRSGMAVAAITTLLLVSLYLFAPALRNAGPAGAALVEARAEVDAGRIWLKQQVAALFVVEMQR